MKKICFFIAILFIALVGNINAQTDYGIEIAGVKVTSENCNNITGARISGSVSYNDESKTLTLNNATIDGGIGFNGEVEDITITLVGSNYAYSIGSVTNTKIINGDGRLSVLSINCIHEKNTIIEDCTVEVTNTAGWAMFSYGLTKLTIKNANLSVKGKDVAIGRFKDIELMCCEIVKPTNAQIIDNELDSYRISKYIYNEDGTIATEVVIEKTEGNCFYTYTEELSAIICDNETYTFAGKELSTADVYYDTIHIDEKTDSVYILTLTVNPTYDTTIYDTIQIEGAGEDYDVTNIDSLQTIYGCDSIVTTITHYYYTAGIEDVANNNAISIYPNPAKDFITIEGKGEVVITNSIGQVAKEIKDNNVYRTIDIKDFESGVYYIKIGEKIQKLVVE